MCGGSGRMADLLTPEPLRYLNKLAMEDTFNLSLLAISLRFSLTRPDSRPSPRSSSRLGLVIPRSPSSNSH